MDCITFVTPATVRSLLVPVNELEQSDFEKILETLKRVKDVRAVDLIRNPGKFNPQGYPQGHLYFNFITRDEDSETLFLHDYEPFRKTAIVIGVAKWNRHLTDDKIRNWKTELKKKYTAPISHFTLIFECPEGYTCKLSDVYTVEKDTSDMETRICDLASRFLCNFSTYASAYEHTTLRSPGNLNHSFKESKKRHSTSFMIDSEKTKQLGARGRKLKLSANFYLMAGNLKSALSDFCEAIYNLKTVNDYLWLASAFDGLAVCVFLLSSIGAPYELPPFINSLLDSSNEVSNVLSSPATSPRSSFQLRRLNSLNGATHATGTNTTPQFNLHVVPFDVVETTILNCGRLAVSYYEQAKNFLTDYVPQIVVSESLLRYAFLLVLINTNGKFDMKLIQQVLYTSATFDDTRTSDDFDFEQFNNLCFYILNSDFRHLSSSQQLKIFYTLTFLYSRTNMRMKKCLMIKNFFDLVISAKNIISVNRFEYESLSVLLKDYCENYGITTNKSNCRNPNYMQKKILTQILELCEKIHYFEGYMCYSYIILRYFNTLLSMREQIEIHEKIKEFKMFVSQLPSYWDPHILLDFEFEKSDDKIVEGEECMVNVLLRNPFAFEIEINDFKLSTVNAFPLDLMTLDKKNDGLNSVPTIYIKPHSEVRVPIIIVPQRNGTLIVDGITASVDLCENQKFTAENREVLSFLPKINKETKVPYGDNNLVKKWETDVVHKQPLLKIVDIKLTDKWLMLLDGERKQFQIILKNISNTEINHLISKYKDSTTDTLSAELNDKSLQPNDVYEIEYQLLVKKSFRILNKNDLAKIKGNELFCLDVEIIGKLGVNEANLVFEYSFQKDTFSEFKRSLSIPVNLTVYSSIELAGCDIISLTSNTRINEENSDLCWKYLETMRRNNHKLSNFCLLALDFVNMWSEEMEIHLECTPQSSHDIEKSDSSDSIEKLTDNVFKVSSLLQSRKNVRMFIPLLRMDFDEDLLNRRIPSLRNKQFVIDKRTSSAEQTFIKHAFWYKEEILKRIKATWRIPSHVTDSIHSGKTGEIDMRGFRFSSKMIEVLEVEKIGVSLKLLDAEENELDVTNVQMNTFYTIRVKLTNRNKSPIFGIIRHIPVCKDPPYAFEKKVLLNGVLQFSIVDPLEPGDHRTYDLGILFIERGEIEWGALFDEIDGLEEGNVNIKKQHLQREQLKFKVH